MNTDSICDQILRSMPPRKRNELRLLVQRQAEHLDDVYEGNFEPLFTFAEQECKLIAGHCYPLSPRGHDALVYALAVYALTPCGKQIGDEVLKVPSKWYIELKTEFIIYDEDLDRIR